MLVQVTRGPYAVVRHPLYVGWMIAFWATPTMTVTHLVFAALLTAYMLIAIPFEERNLVQHFGEKYTEYRQRVGGLIPRVGWLDAGLVNILAWWGIATVLVAVSVIAAAQWVE